MHQKKCYKSKSNTAQDLNCLHFICGDKGIGFNFNVQTCESCKCFFRRNAFRDLKCKYDTNDCVVNVVTRRKCAKCRINKCFNEGMNKQMILDEVAKSKRMEKITKNREKRHKMTDQVDPEVTEPEADPDHTSTQSTVPLLCITNTNNQAHINTDHIFSTSLVNDKRTKAYERAFTLGMSICPVDRPLTDSNIFNELEGNRFTELMSATDLLKIQTSNNTSVVVTIDQFYQIIDIQRNTDIANVVKMCRHLFGFNTLCDQDQLILLKHGSLEIHSMRSITYYDSDRQYWTMNLDERNALIITMDFIKTAESELYLEFKEFITNVCAAMESDINIINMMTAIVLFNPYRPGLEHRELVRLQQQIYMYLLKRYLILKYQDRGEADNKFMRLMSLLIDLYYQETRCKQRTQDRDQEQLPPLLKEIITD